ncbi:tRNA pseudouridine(13) synthase TruD [Shewanella sp. AS1]|uniref:tRNA pseudouridine(13) synthase TruD n=1 Tax=Shewanella sp. AS1 TaxID=2907626 RepID=UPI001F35E3EB|nr:tRNA pseudouridine(13) synthase TruD [Shewanella sp. AS1]MCE9678085.1 tRNA pseudouridine(13) synthase TruD [Shewanella sp. AS1]
MSELTYLHGKPLSTADLRTENSDFLVDEILPFLPTGEGEHHMLHIRKEGLNTADVARMLSSFAGVHPKEVTFAGQKDKNAITTQWFGVRIPGKETPLWQSLNSEQLTVLSSSRHSKKLRTGALAGNRFTLTLRALSDVEDLVKRIELVKQTGVPNYFGEQRFGHDGKNLIFGRQMLAGKKVKDRNKRSMYLSAVRSNLFNQMVSTRLAEQGSQALEGDCVMLSGSKSYFVAESWDETLLERLAQKDIQLSAPLWGRGQALSQGAALAFEARVAQDFSSDCEGLEQAGLTQERRTLFLEPQNLSYEVEGDVVILKFALPSGCFATSLLRELAQYEDVNEREYRQRREQAQNEKGQSEQGQSEQNDRGGHA